MIKPAFLSLHKIEAGRFALSASTVQLKGRMRAFRVLLGFGLSALRNFKFKYILTAIQRAGILVQWLWRERLPGVKQRRVGGYGAVPCQRKAQAAAWSESWARKACTAASLLIHVNVFFCLFLFPCVGKAASEDVDLEYERRVQEARHYDPMCCKEEDRDRESAVELYRNALSVRPGDLRNIEVEHRIAQLYAFYSGPKTGERPMPGKAARVFEHIVNTYPPSQLRWVQSHIGLASCNAMLGNPVRALDHYRRVLEVDTGAIELPLGLEYTDEEEAKEWAKKQVEEMRLLMVDKIAYLSRRAGPGVDMAQMAEISRRYQGTDVGKRAEARLMAAMGAPVDSILEDTLYELVYGTVVPVEQLRGEAIQVPAMEVSEGFEPESKVTSAITESIDASEVDEFGIVKIIVLAALLFAVAISVVVVPKFVRKLRQAT